MTIVIRNLLILVRFSNSEQLESGDDSNWLFHMKPIKINTAFLLPGIALANFFYLFLPAEAFSTAYTWNSAGGNSWNTPADWTPNTSFPHLIGDTASFGSIISANRTILLNTTGITIGALSIDSTHNITIGSGTVDTLTFQQSSGNANLTITDVNGNGAHTMAAPVLLNSPLILSQGSTGTFLFSGALSGSSSFTKTGTGLVSIPAATTNPFTGSFIVNQGTLKVGSINNIINSSGVNLGGGTLEMAASLTGSNPPIT